MEPNYMQISRKEIMKEIKCTTIQINYNIYKFGHNLLNLPTFLLKQVQRCLTFLAFLRFDENPDLVNLW